MNVTKRTDGVKEGNKYYYKICRCGELKENYKNSYCNTCSQERLMKYKSSGSGVDETVLPGITSKRKHYIAHLNEFVTRIKNRGGMASLEEIMVELITIYTFFLSTQHIDGLSTGKQVMKMWEELEELNMKLNSKVTTKPKRSENGTRTCNKCGSTGSIEDFPKTRNTCKNCISEYQKVYNQKKQESGYKTEYMKKYKDENRELLKEYRREYYKEYRNDNTINKSDKK